MVNKRPITVTSATTIYGQDSAKPFGELIGSEYIASPASGLLVNHSIFYNVENFTAEIPVGITKPKTIDNSFNESSVVILDNNVNDVSANYDITSVYGKLTVIPTGN